ncbi:hypothetical protein BABINDRAFT_163260 [Babjeviella inositovora NRRL Y-12698]|uniref:Structural maintenance of chromosomes protein 5 n=1 Tax=Babjeviella inositovora NRRL Y-12698 TaxID=984486 RepID=A0A1E3QJL6_9ASCO|nr:uncharacterized protein BABINDRAFT_163260 [Babjeviella inositovora NRRL Y-12698]ODQ77885.1 hypothetical protein BABINDRAFT_163260 [Babjeviella inositovora NRRL Y-12698]
MLRPREDWEPTPLGDFVAPEHRPKKRVKIESGSATINDSANRATDGDNTYLPGSIIRVKVKNFITYSIAEFHLGPTLNMIIGPNGTGKSTLVSAICLGLGGNERLISRKDMKSMIKINETQASIEIELKNKTGPNIVIKRTFGEKKSVYRVDGREANEKAVKSICHGLNIQLDNLCQFLPQERVANFAQMTQEQLLKETERSVGSGDLYTKHQALIDLDQTRTIGAETVAKAEAEYDVLVTQRAKLEQNAKNYEAYQIKRRELDIHKKILPYARLQDKMEQLKELKAVRDEAKQNLAEFRENKRPFVNELEKKRVDFAEAEQDLAAAVAKADALVGAAQRAKLAIAELEEQLTTEAAKKKSLQERAMQKRGKLQEAIAQKEVILAGKAEVEAKAAQARDITEAKARRDALHSERSELRESLDELERALGRRAREQQTRRGEVERLRSRLTSSDRIGVFDQQRHKQFGEAKRAHLFLRELAALKGRYWESPLMSLDVQPAYVKALETVVDLGTKVAVTVTAESYAAVSRAIFDDAKINTPIRTVGTKALSLPMSAEQVRTYGFDGFIADFVSGPKAVVQMLGEQCQIHKIPVALRPLSEEQLRTLQTPDANGRILFIKFIAGDFMYNVSKSNYGSRQIMYRTQSVLTFQTFGSTGLTEERKREIAREIQQYKVDFERAKLEEDEVRAQASELRDKLQALTTEYKEVHEEVRFADGVKASLEKFELRVKTINEKITKLEAECARDYTGYIRQCEQAIYALHCARMGKAIACAQVAREMAHFDGDVVRARYRRFVHLNKVTTLQSLLDSVDTQREKLDQRYRAAREAYNAAKNEDLSDLRNERHTLSEEEREYMGNICKVYLEKQELTEVEINKKIKKIRGELEMFPDTSESAIATLQKHLEEIARLEEDLPRLKQQAEAIEAEIKTIQTKWEPRLDSLVAKISAKFASTFTKVASAGEVRVFKAPLFKDWKMEIMVKFRDDSDFAVLDSHVQSGGERAVSTIFFMMALQGITNFPFRVVDEINQGMDPRNEKIVHKHLVENACAGELTSQYFLVTPKLLQGLYYHPGMRLHCIVTGPQHDEIDDNPVDLGFGDLHRYVQV